MASILLVDDNPEFRRMVAVALTAAKHSVVEAEDGKQAIKLIHSTSFDLVVSDVVMPDRDGFEVLAELRKTRPSLPAILMSGDSPEHASLYLKMAQRLGAAMVLKKPFTIDALLAAVSSLPKNEG